MPIPQNSEHSRNIFVMLKKHNLTQPRQVQKLDEIALALIFRL
jgi:hypothetical protein